MIALRHFQFRHPPPSVPEYNSNGGGRELVALYKCVIGLDVHQAQITACAIIEETDGTTRTEQRQFCAFKRDRRALAEWAAALLPDEVVMESTGIYWKSPYAALEKMGIRAKVVNARHVKNVPGRKTDVGDAQWLATLARAGLLRRSFVPPAKLRELRLISRQRQKLVGLLASEKNRLHKVLTDGGIRLGVVVSDLHGQSARAMVKAIIAGEPPHEVLKRASCLSQGQPRGNLRCPARGTDREPLLRARRTDAAYRGDRSAHCPFRCAASGGAEG